MPFRNLRRFQVSVTLRLVGKRICVDTVSRGCRVAAVGEDSSYRQGYERPSYVGCDGADCIIKSVTIPSTIAQIVVHHGL